MSEKNIAEQRMIEIETKISYQENTIETLQLLVYEQQKAVAKLSLAVEKLTKRIDGAAIDRLEVGPANEKPPHY